MEEGSLRKTPLWKEALDTQGTPLALKKNIFSALIANWSRRLLYGESSCLALLTTKETLCAAEIMSSRVKIPSIEEMRAKRKSKKTKGKSKVDLSTEHKSPQKLPVDIADEDIRMGSAEASQSKNEAEGFLAGRLPLLTLQAFLPLLMACFWKKMK